MLPVPDIPDTVLQHVNNFTGFPEFTFDKLGKARQLHDIVILKGTFDLNDGVLTQAETQCPPVFADEYWDEDASEVSSLRMAGDVLLYKPSTDVLVTGTARHFEGKPTKEWAGMLRVVDSAEKILLQKMLRFTGPRWWQYGLLSGWRLSDPEKTTAVPLRYELAYGGYWINPKETDPALAREVYKPNPSGSGHFGKSHDTRQTYTGPQIRFPSKDITASNYDYVPAGFGPIARFWQPRLKLAGTYDDAWLKAVKESGIAYYPDDLDLRFFQSAPADQITPAHLNGDEWIQLAGVFEEMLGINMQLPCIQIDAILQNEAGQVFKDGMKLDTVHIDLDLRQVYLTWRLCLPQHAGITHAALSRNYMKKNTQ